jgi:hypothetical protein
VEGGAFIKEMKQFQHGPKIHKDEDKIDVFA